MDYSTRFIPMEIFGLIVAESSDEVLKNLRLACRAGRDMATPLLFQCFTVQALNNHTLQRLQEVARHPQLASLVKKFEYQPRMRRSSHNDDERQQLKEQNDLLASNSFVEALIAALKSFTQLRHVELLYPPFGMRGVCNGRSLCVLSDVIRNIYSNICPRLISLSISGLLLVDIPKDLVQDAGNDDAEAAALEQLHLDFHPGDMPSGEMTRIEPDGLQRLLSLLTKLTSVRIGFHLLDRSMRSFDWSVLQCTKLNTLELVELEMSETSLINIITQNAHSIRQIILDRVFLFDGTWAAVYDGIANIEGIIDISEIEGRRYLDGRGSYARPDAASYRRLFAIVEERRERQGLPSMRWPVSPAGFVYRRNFSHLETSLYER
ncbi:hypothetical protein ACQKWADRAFT_304035 [Trichoderma austrokoningii]